PDRIDAALAPTPPRPARRSAPGVRMTGAAMPRKRTILTPGWAGEGANAARRDYFGSSLRLRRKAGGASRIASLRTSAATEKPPHRSIDRPALPLRIEPQRIQLPAQPGELALGQLAGGGNGAFAEPGGVAGAVQVLPGLAIADGADRGQVERRGMVAQGRQRA